MKDWHHFGTPELRAKLKAYYKELDEYRKSIMAPPCRPYFYRGKTIYPPPKSVVQLPQFPEECQGMLCGAKTRSGRPCRNSGTDYRNGRCKFHGGASTGPRTRAGRRQSAINGCNHRSKAKKG